MIHTKVAILGAGPAGSSAAIKLSQLGVSCHLIEKTVFPREKVCGDAISSRALIWLRRLSPDLLAQVSDKSVALGTWQARFVSISGKCAHIPVKVGSKEGEGAAPCLVIPRWDLDNIMFRFAKASPQVTTHEGVEITAIEKNAEGFLLKDKTGNFVLQTQLLIVASGGNSIFTRQHCGIPNDKAHQAAVVRAYFTGVEGMDAKHPLEVFQVKSLALGYFWVFPMANGDVNVGFGLGSDYVSKNKINLKKALWDSIEETPELKRRFANAQLKGEIQGLGLQMGSKLYPFSGDNYILAGEAARLVDPLSGEGIGHAILSGYVAAQHAAEAIEANDFSTGFLRSRYDKHIDRLLRNELLVTNWFSKFYYRPSMLDFLVSVWNLKPVFWQYLIYFFMDDEWRRIILNPFRWKELKTYTLD